MQVLPYRPEFFQNLSYTIQSNKNQVIELMKINGLCLEYASFEMKRDIDVIKAAVKQNGQALYHAKTKPLDLVREALLDCGDCRLFVPDLMKETEVLDLYNKRIQNDIFIPSHYLMKK